MLKQYQNLCAGLQPIIEIVLKMNGKKTMDKIKWDEWKDKAYKIYNTINEIGNINNNNYEKDIQFELHRNIEKDFFENDDLPF